MPIDQDRIEHAIEIFDRFIDRNITHDAAAAMTAGILISNAIKGLIDEPDSEDA